MRTFAQERTLCCAAKRAGLTALLCSGFLFAAVGHGATLQQVEADWQRQDECRLAEIREARVVRFPGTELAWPGAGKAAGGLRVPLASAPQIDARLDEASWQQAAVLPPGPADEMVRPMIRLCRDAGRLYVCATFPASATACFRKASTTVDAGGAVDGVKNGRYGFHTGPDANPWWQVDLGSPQAIGRVVVFNRLDYAPGLRNADRLKILVSDNGETWRAVYDNGGRFFGGVKDGKPLVVNLSQQTPQQRTGAVTARFVRIQVPTAVPLLFHLDEVEIYGTDDPQKNLALGQRADQSSTSRWSRGGPLVTLGGTEIGLMPQRGPGRRPVMAQGEVANLPHVTVGGKAVSADQAAVARDGDEMTVELAIPLDGLAGGFPAAAVPYHGRPTALAPDGGIELSWPEGFRPGFGKNRLLVDVRTEKGAEVTVETMVFTAERPERRIVLQKTLAGAGVLPVQFTIEHEGATAVIVTARQGEKETRNAECFLVEPAAETLARSERLLADFRKAPPEGFGGLRDRIAALAARERATGPDLEARHTLCGESRWMARRIALMNPALNFEHLLVMKRFGQQAYPDVCLNHMPWVSRPGGDICTVSLDTAERPAGENTVHALLGGALGPGHVHGMDLWWDADRVVFGYAKAKSSEPAEGWLDRRTSFELRRTEEPTHLFEMGIDGRGLRQLTSGQWSDLDPTYLPSGEIAFVSERCAYSLQCNELDKDETSCNLYVMRPDGSGIRRLSVTKDGDYLPHTLDDGTIGYTRWEYQERGWANIQSLWFVRPDGTGADALFKQHFNDPWAIEECRSIPGTKKFIAIATGHHTLPAGPLVVVDPHQGMNSPAGISIVTPGIDPPEGGMSGTAVPQGGVRGTGGLCMTPWPLSETTFLVARNYAGQVDPTGFGIYLVDVYGTTELLYRDPTISCFTPIPLRPRPRPPVLADVTDPAKPYAVCAVSNVARGVDGVPPEKVRYLRIARRLPWPYDNTYGGHRYEPDVKRVMINWTPAQVLGIVPVQKDGSAHFVVPADKAVYFQLLDENFMELRRMRSFISFQPGEFRACNGCHETREEVPGVESRFSLALAREPSVPQPPPWGRRPISFLRDVQPVLDKHCGECHTGLKPAGGLDFSGGLTASYNRAYDTIRAAGLVARSNVGDDARITEPLAFGSHKSRLIEVLQKGKQSRWSKLSEEERLRLVTWIDANGPYHDGFINKRIDPPVYDLPNDAELAGKIAAVHTRRCSGCHQPAEVSRMDWIDLGEPARSLFLNAPLAKAAGGAGRCGEAVYHKRDDADYQAIANLVEAAVSEAWRRPRRDLLALLPESQTIRRQPTIVAFGDSTTAPRQGVTVYADILREQLRRQGIEACIVNAGIGGNTTRHALQRLERDVLINYPDLVVLQFGINDAAVDVWKDPPATGPRVPLSEYRDNMALLVNELTRYGAKVILMTPNPIRWSDATRKRYGRTPYDPESPDGFNLLLEDYAEAAREVARDKGVTLIDVHAQYEAHGRQAGRSIDALLQDGIHTNTRGQGLAAELLVEKIAAMVQ